MKIALLFLLLLTLGSARAEWEQLDENNQAVITLILTEFKRIQDFRPFGNCLT